MSITNGDAPAFPCNETAECAPSYGLTARQVAAIHLCVPDSGEEWLDEMIRTSLRDRFAGQALAEMKWTDIEVSACNCYAVADALLAARGEVRP